MAFKATQFTTTSSAEVGGGWAVLLGKARGDGAGHGAGLLWISRHARQKSAEAAAALGLQMLPAMPTGAQSQAEQLLLPDSTAMACCSSHK